MAARIDDRNQRRGDSLTLRLRPHESDSIRRHADSRGWSVSHWLRVAIDSALASEDRGPR
jgi:hypothetical protein